METAASLRNSPTGAAPPPRIALTVHIAPDLREGLTRLAIATQCPLATVVREALAAYVASSAK